MHETHTEPCRSRCAGRPSLLPVRARFPARHDCAGCGAVCFRFSHEREWCGDLLQRPEGRRGGLTNPRERSFRGHAHPVSGMRGHRGSSESSRKSGRENRHATQDAVLRNARVCLSRPGGLARHAGGAHEIVVHEWEGIELFHFLSWRGSGFTALVSSPDVRPIRLGTPAQPSGPG
jgi:hypothetical protein